MHSAGIVQWVQSRHVHLLAHAYPAFSLSCHQEPSTTPTETHEVPDGEVVWPSDSKVATDLGAAGLTMDEAQAHFVHRLLLPALAYHQYCGTL